MLDEIVDRGARGVLRDPSAETDERLAALVCAGNGPAFAELVRRHRPALIGYARRLARTDAGAEDAVQHAFLQAWIAFRRDGAEIRDLRAWLFRAVHNATVSGMRRARLEPLDPSMIAESASADAEFEARLAVREAFAGLAALPELQRNVMLSTAVGGDNHEQVAETYGLTKGAVRGLIYRARANLRAAAAAVTPAPFVGWLMRHRSIGGPAGDTLVGAGSAGVAGGVVKSGMIAMGLAAGTGGLGIAVITAAHDRDRARGGAIVHHLRDVDGSTGALMRTADARLHSTSPTSPRSARADRASPPSSPNGSARGRAAGSHAVVVARARGSAVRAVSFALVHPHSRTRGSDGRSGSAPGDGAHDATRPRTPGSHPGDGSNQRVAGTPPGTGSSSGSGDAPGPGPSPGSGDGGTHYGDGGTSGGSDGGTGSGAYGRGGSGTGGGGSGDGGGQPAVGSGAGSDGANTVVGTGSGDAGSAGGSDHLGYGGSGSGAGPGDGSGGFDGSGSSAAQSGSGSSGSTSSGSTGSWSGGDNSSSGTATAGGAGISDVSSR